MITKDYKRESFAVYLDLRYKLWSLQFTVFIVAVCLGYPTEMLYRVTHKGYISKESTISIINDL